MRFSVLEVISLEQGSDQFSVPAIKLVEKLVCLVVAIAAGVTKRRRRIIEQVLCFNRFKINELVICHDMHRQRSVVTVDIVKTTSSILIYNFCLLALKLPLQFNFLDFY